ncbi:family 2 glycosyltransferase [Melampsora larici-populina 98AG31]|uniref:chitin synthase n=1 Tax=Melampsora larici-populina (strain 98AG31 / pathotype 3-4-7) TaxID=747676 RepID=F4R4D4_MELLP|nr:family 2 glycosyltransferase [Melampsora larici-populina 98AG31]EGG12793.1 family 2 glycosyltransferase [Melampsora larici-populina 98AG31]
MSYQRQSPQIRSRPSQQQQQQQQQQQPPPSNSASYHQSRPHNLVQTLSPTHSPLHPTSHYQSPITPTSLSSSPNSIIKHQNLIQQPTIKQPNNLSRAKTLTRPERHVNPTPLINSNLSAGFSNNPNQSQSQSQSWYHPWPLYVRLLSFPIPSCLLSTCGIPDPIAQQAWREKLALCSIALLAGLFTAFVSRSRAFNATEAISTRSLISQELIGQDITSLFDHSHQTFQACQGFEQRQFVTSNLCANLTHPTSTCLLPQLNPHTLQTLRLQNTSRQTSTKPIPTDLVDSAIRLMLSNPKLMGQDATRLFSNSIELRNVSPCLQARFRSGAIDKITPGCFASQLFLYVSLVVILGVVMVRFIMAIFFSWFISDRLIKPPRNLRRKGLSPAVLPAGANLSLSHSNGHAPWVNTLQSPPPSSKSKPTLSEKTSLLTGPKANQRNLNPKPRPKSVNPVDSNGLINLASIGAELFCVCLVTCYSEGAEGIGKTLDSIAGSDYADSRKLLFIVCDGMITGHGEKLSTPDICVSMIEPDPRFSDPMPMSYHAVASGSKEHNQAMVYAGHYISSLKTSWLMIDTYPTARVKGHRTPVIVVVKCGTAEEGRIEKKPGNRGKRDSQMILMNFFSRVTYNDRMSPLDYDLFRKIQALMGVTPDFFEVCLMVDADTTVGKDSITHLVNCMQHDPYIMGVCGETRIANKRATWVTTIQVFEYYISHHLAKAFESVFGGVTCLPGCFSMYRLKARRSNESDWIPILSQPEICREYSQSTVTTLHQKNLLLLGEDRFLTTLMIRTFPSRKMMFCPQAKCRTVVPEEFKVLLSQRRRWINSTIHNLMELVRVPNLCGTFCFSMQFVVFMELTGTIVLPIAISLTYSLVINSIINPPRNFADAIPLILLAAILGLPAILILMTSRNISYVLWMLIYLVALPVWNFVLPLYAFWHFDDFSWGETRKVEGDGKGGHDHSQNGNDQIDSDLIPLRRWEDWERSRLKKIKREERRKKEFERAFGVRQFHSNYNHSELGGTDTISVVSSDDDRWGMNIGNYDGNHHHHHHHHTSTTSGGSFGPPPVGLYEVSNEDGVSVVDGNELEMMLETGWDEPIISDHHHSVLDSYHSPNQLQHQHQRSPRQLNEESPMGYSNEFKPNGSSLKLLDQDDEPY